MTARLGIFIVAIACTGVCHAQSSNNGTLPTPFSGHSLSEMAMLGPTFSILYAPSNPDDPDYRAEISAAADGAVVDYYDARNGTPSAFLLSQYDAVYTWPNFDYDNNTLFGDRLADYVDDGGTVVLGVFCTYTSGNFLAGRIMDPNYCPVTSPLGTGHFTESDWNGTASTRVHECVEAYNSMSRDELALQGNGIVDARYDDFEIAHAYRPDQRVIYSNGEGHGAGGADGDWGLLVANAARYGDLVRVLVYEDTFDAHFAQASIDLGYVTQVEEDSSDFVTALTSSEWDIVVVDSSLNLISGAVADAVSDYVTGGGKAICSYWDLDGSSSADPAATLRATFDVESTFSFSDEMDVDAWSPEHPIWSDPFDVASLSTGASSLSDNGDFLTPVPGAFTVAGFTPNPLPGQAATIVGNQCRTIVNGFMPDDMAAPDVDEFAQNQIRYLATRSSILILDLGSSGELTKRAVQGLGVRPTRTDDEDAFLAELGTCAFDLVIVEPPCCSLSPAMAPALSAFIGSGGRVLFSYWNLDADPGLQNLFGVDSTIEITVPETLFAWEVAHPIWTTPNTIGVAVETSGTDTFFDNGDRLNPAATATVVGGFDVAPSADGGAIVIANGGQTIVNGFDYDGLDACTVTNLIQNEIVFLLDSGTGDAFVRGDCNDDGGTDISDMIFILGELFALGDPAVCDDACDMNDDGAKDISDAVYGLASLFVLGSPAIPAPVSCGADPTADALDCAAFGDCP